MTRSISNRPTSVGPSTAERIRSACAKASGAVLAIPGADPVPAAVHPVRSVGDAVLLVPADSIASALAWQAGTGGLPAMLELTDQSTLALREPVRSLVWLRGTLHPVAPEHERALAAEVAEEHPHPGLLDVGDGATLLTLRLSSAVIADSSGAESVDVHALRQAQPDPLREVEAAWLEHLETDHGDVVDLLARHLPPSVRQGTVRPLSLDRYGLSLRVEGFTTDGDAGFSDRDVRLPFDQPVDDAEGLNRAIRILIGCPFLNGLRNGS